MIKTIDDIPRDFIGKVSLSKDHSIRYFTIAARRAMEGYLENKKRSQGANFKKASDVSLCIAVINAWATELAEKAMGRKVTGRPHLVKRFK